MPTPGERDSVCGLEPSRTDRHPSGARVYTLAHATGLLMTTAILTLPTTAEAAW